MPKRSAEEMMKAIPSSSSQEQQQPEKISQFQSTSKSVSSVIRQSATRTTRSKTRRHINNLPDEILEKILNKLETYEQYKFRRVCHRWKNCIEKLFALTQCLKLNLMETSKNYKLKRTDLKKGPPISEESIQFESHWTEPAVKFFQSATIMEKQFSAYCVNALCRLFYRVPYLVIHFELNHKQENLDNLICMIKYFKMLESFSLIRSRGSIDDQNYIQLCNILEGLSPLRRLELYVHQSGSPIVKFPMMKSLGWLEHFSLGSWPLVTQDVQQGFLQNVGGSLKNLRQMKAKLKLNEIKKTEPHELTSLCIPMDLWQSKRLNLAQVFESNAELQNVKRLQLLNVTSLDEVKPALELCPKLQSLALYMEDELKQMKVPTNPYIEMVNQSKHLTELTIFNGCLSPFEAGPCAPNIRKLTMAANSLFDLFKEMFYFQESDNMQEESEDELDENEHANPYLVGHFRNDNEDSDDEDEDSDDADHNEDSDDEDLDDADKHLPKCNDKDDNEDSDEEDEDLDNADEDLPKWDGADDNEDADDEDEDADDANMYLPKWVDSDDNEDSDDDNEDSEYEDEHDEDLSGVTDENRPMGGYYSTNWLTFTKVADEFVKMIALKFPSLEQLTILSDEDTQEYSNRRECWLNFKRIIIDRLSARCDKLKIINIEMFHPIYKNVY